MSNEKFHSRLIRIAVILLFAMGLSLTLSTISTFGKDERPSLETFSNTQTISLPGN